VHRVTIRPNTLITVPSGCIIVTSTFTFSPVATSFIGDRKDYLINYDWPDTYRSIIGELDTYALAEIQYDTGEQLPMDKFTMNTAINALRNVRNETITTQKILDYGGISGMVIGIIVALACITFGCYTCFTRTPSERSLRRSHPHTTTQAAMRYTPATAIKNQPTSSINLNQPQQARSNQEREAPNETTQYEDQTPPWLRTEACWRTYRGTETRGNNKESYNKQGEKRKTSHTRQDNTKHDNAKHDNEGSTRQRRQGQDFLQQTPQLDRPDICWRDVPEGRVTDSKNPYRHGD
jgi:hypothetical protein